MKKSLLLSILVSLLMSFLFCECHRCPVTYENLVDRTVFYAYIKTPGAKFSMIGDFGNYRVDSMLFTDLNGVKLTKPKFEIEEDLGQITCQFVLSPSIEQNKSYKEGIIIHFPTFNPSIPFAGDIDTIKYEYHIADDGCSYAILDDFKIFFNDSLYYHGVKPRNQNFIFYK